MKKNVASQKIGVQMVSATDGSAFTGSVTVAVTGDAGTQATGSVGSGACTHEGNGYHTYAPAQAETNYDLIAFTFTGTGAVPATVQVFTDFPQTGDGFARIGAPAGASASADIAALKTVADAVKTKTDNLPSDPADQSLVIAATDAIVAAISALNNLSASQVNAEMVDALATDTYAEPGQGNPAATASLAAKINYLFKAWRNKKTQTATTFNLFADDASTVDQKATVSDDATTFTRGEIASGP